MKKFLRSLFRTVSLSSFAAVCLFAFPAETTAYEEDTHFLMTYVLCKSAGFTHEEALVIAAVDQGMDDSRRVNAHDNGKPQVEEEWRWHALDRNGEMTAKGVIARRDLYFKEALEEKDPRIRLIRLGIFFHYQQDTWAHRHHEKKNHLSRDAFTTFNTPAGHGPWGSKPDRPPLDPVAAFMSLEDGIVFAVDFIRRGLERDPNPFLADYRQTGGKVYKKWKDKRKGRFFKQLEVSSSTEGSSAHFLKSLIYAQVDAYQRSRDLNPFYFGKKTPNKLEFDKARTAFQSVCDSYEISIGATKVPTKEDKILQGFTEMTTDGLLSLSPESTY